MQDILKVCALRSVVRLQGAKNFPLSSLALITSVSRRVEGAPAKSEAPAPNNTVKRRVGLDWLSGARSVFAKGTIEGASL